MIDTGAYFSNCRRYRYALWRTWNQFKPIIMFLGLNPSIADEVKNDPTVTRCIDYTKSWGYGGLYMMNIFAFRTTFPLELKKTRYPIGKDNDWWIKKIYRKVELSIAAWGNNGLHLDRSKDIIKIIPDLYCLKINNSGQPSHPLYLKSKLKPIKYEQSKYI